jgi:AraC-like DNA-binding protein
MNREFPFWIQRNVHDCNNTPKVHGHDFIELVYVVSGEGEHYFEGDRYGIRSGDVFIINPGEVHTYTFEKGQRIEIINCLFKPALIHETLLRELEISQSMDYFYVHPFLNRNDRFQHRLNLYGQDSEAVLALLENMIKEIGGRSSGFSTIIRLRMIELLILLSRFYVAQQSLKSAGQSSNKEMFARRIRGYLERNYEKKISLNAISEIFNISVRQLNRLINQEIGMSFIDLLHQIRIERAKHLLMETDEKVIAVAAMVGYEDPAFFSRLFQRIVGCPPGKYRTRS